MVQKAARIEISGIETSHLVRSRNVGLLAQTEDENPDYILIYIDHAYHGKQLNQSLSKTRNAFYRQRRINTSIAKYINCR